MEQVLVQALSAPMSIIDITTTGRRSGKPHRLEVVFHNIDGQIYLSGRPGRRDWYANLVAHPRFTFHLKRGVRADLPATAKPITDPKERQRLLTEITQRWNSFSRLEAFVRTSPLVAVEFDGGA